MTRDEEQNSSTSLFLQPTTLFLPCRVLLKECKAPECQRCSSLIIIRSKHPLLCRHQSTLRISIGCKLSTMLFLYTRQKVFFLGHIVQSNFVSAVLWFYQKSADKIALIQVLIPDTSPYCSHAPSMVRMIGR